jgi:hypothetical protein
MKPIAYITSLALAGIVFAQAAFASSSDLVLHVHIDNAQKGKGITIEVPWNPKEGAEPLHFAGDDVTINGAELRAIWRQLKAAPEGTTITVKKRGETVRATRSGDYLVLKSLSRHDKRVTVKLPSVVVDAVLSEKGGRVSEKQIAEGVARNGAFELVKVETEDTRVRVWIDREGGSD